MTLLHLQKRQIHGAQNKIPFPQKAVSTRTWNILRYPLLLLSALPSGTSASRVALQSVKKVSS